MMEGLAIRALVVACVLSPIAVAWVLEGVRNGSREGGLSDGR